MTIMPKFRPGQLVSLSHSNLDMVGLVKSTQFARRRGDPVMVLVQWCGKYRQQEEYIYQRDLKLVEAV